MSIRSRLDDLPVYETGASYVDAHHYNLAHIALKRLGKTLRLELPNLHNLELILEDDTWAVIDRSLNDIPIIAWLNFAGKHRDNLHEPIACERRLYHTHALIIIDKVLEAMALLLGEKLAALPDVPLPPVTPLTR